MNDNLRKKIEAFDQKRKNLLDEMETLDAETLAARPLAGKWSILEILEHLVVAEKEVLGGLPAYTELTAAGQSFKNGLMYRLVLAVLRLGIPVKAPSEKMLPKNNLNLAEVRREWDASQNWFRGYLGGLDKNGLKKAVFRHPVSGPINVEQAVGMSLAHLDSHIRQIKKRLELINRM